MSEEEEKAFTENDEKVVEEGEVTGSEEITEDAETVEEGTEEKKEKTVKFRRPLNQTILEAVFYVSGRPLSVTKIATEFGWEPKEVREMVRELAKKLKKIKAELQLLEVQRDRWVLQLPLKSYPVEFKEIIDNILLDYPKKYVHDDNTRKVLTHIAFHQPVSKAKLWKTISTDNPKDTESWLTIPKLEEILSLLIQEGFVRLSGSPLQYKTTAAFANEFGFDSVRLKLKQQLVKRLEKKTKSK
jgi:chromosome segregation and condensation protein ScpB